MVSLVQSWAIARAAYVGGHLSAVLWLVYGMYFVTYQFEWNLFLNGSEPARVWLWRHKEEFMSLIFEPVLHIYGYVTEALAKQKADQLFVKDTLNVSLNTLEESNGDPKLKFRTLAELPPSQVFSDKIHCIRVEQLADETTNANPYLRLDVRKGTDMEMLKIVGNYLSSMSSDGHIAKEMGFPVREETFVYALTNEHFGGHVAVKLRLLVIREQTLKDIYDGWFRKTVLDRYTWQNNLDMPWTEYVNDRTSFPLVLETSAGRGCVDIRCLGDLPTLEESDFPITLRYRHSLRKVPLNIEGRATLMGLSNEVHGDNGKHNGKQVVCKIRVDGDSGTKWEVAFPTEETLIVEPRHLESRCPVLEAPSHASRWFCLKKMAVMYCDKHDPDHSWISKSKITMARTQLFDGVAVRGAIQAEFEAAENRKRREMESVEAEDGRRTRPRLEIEHPGLA